MSFEEPSSKGWIENEKAVPEKNKICTILEIQGKYAKLKQLKLTCMLSKTCFERL